MSKRIDFTGKVFGRLTVLEFAYKNDGGAAMWKCRCICGTEVVCQSGHLKSGGVISCGCYRKELLTKHGHSKRTGRSSEMSSWSAMKQRCNNKNSTTYPKYGGRGITICERWLNSFENFLADMGKKPSPFHSIDRYPNKNGNYEPGNCRWATRKQQAANTSTNVWIEYKGEKMLQIDYMKIVPIRTTRLNKLLLTQTADQIAKHYLDKTRGFTNYVKDIVGLKFNKLTVIAFSHVNEKRCSMWKCVCDCGKYKTVSGVDLRSTNVKSCGCLTHKK